MSTGRFEPIADKYLNPKIRGVSEWMCECPFCGGHASLQFNVDVGLWYCFRCEAKGTAKSLVRRLGGDYSDPVVSVQHIREQMDRMKLRKKREQLGSRVFPENTLRRYDFPDVYWTEIRGFSDSTIKKWNLGYDPISNRNTIAYRNPDGELLGVIQRLKDPDVEIRYIYPEGFNRKGSLFGSWHVETDRVALVEGSTDVIALDDATRPALGQYGSSISHGQIKLLHRLGIRHVVLFYDYDEAGRKAEEKSRELLNGFFLYTVMWDTNKYCWHKKLCGCGEHTWRTIGKCQNKKPCRCGRVHEADPNTLTIKERRRMFDNAKPIGKKKSKWDTRKFVR